MSERAQARAAVEQARAGLLAAEPFTAHVALHLDIRIVEDARLPTAGTDGRRIFINPEYVLGLDPDERLGLIAHEVWHCALDHRARRQGRGSEIWNLAVDHEVNMILTRAGLTLPAGAVLFRQLERKSAEVVYDSLCSSAPVGMKGFDLHLEGPSEGPLAGATDPAFAPDEGDWPDRIGRALLARAVSTWPGGADGLPGSLGQYVRGVLGSRTDWRAHLAAFFQARARRSPVWHRPNRRHLHAGLVLPSRHIEAIGLAIAIDVSGSTWDLAGSFLAEVAAIRTCVTVSRLEIILFDTEIRGRINVSGGDPVPLDLHLEGGGGTRLDCPFDALAEAPPDGLVILTDGFGTVTSHRPAYPVLWALAHHGKPPVDWGDIAWIDHQA